MNIGIWGMVLSNLFFSLMAILIRLNPGSSALEAAFFRFTVGALLVTTLALFGKTTLRFHNTKDLIIRGLVGGVSVVLYYWPINEIGLSKTTLFQYAYPFYAIIFSALFLKEKITPVIIGLLIMAMSGLTLLNLPAFTEGRWSPMVIAAWASGVTSGLAVMFVKKLSETENSSSIFLAQCLGGFWIFLLPATAATSSQGWVSAAFLLAIGLTAAIGQLLMTWSYKYVDVSTGSLLGTLVPILNITAGVLFFGERFQFWEAVGALITLSACILLVVVKIKKPC